MRAWGAGVGCQGWAAHVDVDPNGDVGVAALDGARLPDQRGALGAVVVAREQVLEAEEELLQVHLFSIIAAEEGN